MIFPQQRAPCRLLRVTLATSNNNTVSLQKFLSREHYKIYDVKSIHAKGKCRVNLHLGVCLKEDKLLSLNLSQLYFHLC